MADRPNQSDAQKQNHGGSANDSQVTTSGTEEDSRFGRFNRRSYLKAGAATAIGTVGLSGQATAETRDGISFNQVVDAVDDLGMDPNGNQAIDGKLDDAWGSGTLIEFPPGEYLVTREHNWFSDSNCGMVGKTGNREDVEFVFPSGYDDRFLNVRFGKNWLIGHFTIQQTEDKQTGVGCSFAPDDNAKIRNLEIAGYNPRHKQRGLSMTVYESNGSALLDRYVRKGGSDVGDYPSGTQALLISREHKGTIKITDPHVENAGENGIYASRCPGEVQIEGGYFANNDVASVRIAGEGSYVKDSTFVIDTDNANNSGSFDNVRGLWIESGDQQFTGGRVENCDFIMKSANNSGGLLLVHTTAGDVEIENCRFQNETRWGTLHALKPSNVSGSGPVNVRNCSFTGGHSSPNHGAIDLEGRDQSLVSDCCIQMGGSNHGVVVENASGCTVRRSTINVNGQMIRSPGSNVAESGNSSSGSCPAPTDSGSGAGNNTGGSDGGSGDETGSDEESDSGNESGTGSGDETETGSGSGSDEGSDDSTERGGTGGQGGDSDGSSGSSGSNGSGGSSGGERTLTLKSSSLSRYSFEVSGDLAFDPAYGTEDALNGSSATGVLAGGRDQYTFSGDIVSFDIAGPATVLIDGQEVDPSAIVEDGSSEDSSESNESTDTDSSSEQTETKPTTGSGGTHTLSLTSDDISPYSFSVTGDVDFDPNYGTEDRIKGKTVRGVLAGGRDRYKFSGQIEDFDVEGDAKVLLDGTRINPNALPSATDGSSEQTETETETETQKTETETERTESDSGSSDAGLANHIFLKSDDLAPYTLEVDGDIAFDPNYGTEDNIGDSSSSGVIAGGGDAYRFSGKVTKFEVDGELTVVLNGEEVAADDVVGRGN